MPPTVVRLAFSLVLGVALSGAGSEAQVRALQILDKSFDPQTHRLSYELWNESSRIITAWRLSLAWGDAHGHARASVLDQDLSGRAEGPLAPGDTLAATWELETGEEAEAPAALSLAVSAVVFDDRTYAGSREAAAAILEGREARWAELDTLLGALESERWTDRPPQAWVATLRQRAGALRGQAAASELDGALRREVAAQLSTTRLELAQWLEGAAEAMLVAVDADAPLERLLDDLRQRVEAARRALPAHETAGGSHVQAPGGAR